MKLHARHNLILDVFKKEKKPLSSRDVMKKLGFTNTNEVRPRITELFKEGYLSYYGSKKCDQTSNKVAVWIFSEGK